MIILKSQNKLKSGKILVTGGAGFIGSALIWELNKKGFSDIIITDVLKKDDKWRNLAPLKYEDYFEADDFIGWLEKCPTFLKDMGIKTVFHFGSCSLDMEVDASFLVENNFSYTKILADNALSSGAKFIYASSTAAYGDGSKGFSEKDEDLHKYIPLTMYGYAKQMFELWAQKRGWLDLMTGLKFFNLYGPNEFHKGQTRSFVLKATLDAIEKGSINLYKSLNPDFADGMQLRDYLYIKDAVKMILHLASKDSKGIYNLSNGQPYTFLDLANCIFDTLGKPRNINFVDMPEEKRKGYIYKKTVSADKLIASGYSEKITSMQEGVSDYINNYILKDERLGQ